MSNKNFTYRSACPICSTDDRTFITSRGYNEQELQKIIIERYAGVLKVEDIAEARYEVAKCTHCGFLYQTYVPTDDFSKKIYSLAPERQQANLDKKSSSEPTFFLRRALESQKIALFLEKDPNKIRVLEFGAGWGQWLHMAKSFGYSVEGFEIAPELVAHAEKNGLMYSVSFNELSGKQFDFIYSDQVFEHITYPVEILKQLVGFLRPGGILYIRVPNCIQTQKSLAQNPKSLLKNLYPLEHINGFTNATLVYFAKVCGLVKLPFRHIIQTLLRSITIRYNTNHIQEIIKDFHGQTRSAGIYFIKEKNTQK